MPGSADIQWIVPLLAQVRYNEDRMKQEQYPKMELDRELVQAFATTFIPRFDLYPMQLPNGRYVCAKKHLDLSLVSLHLQGAPTLGAYALDPDSQAKWICL